MTLNLSGAIRLAAKAHAAQVDKKGEPYILHPLRVMLAVAPEDRIVAVLHDVLEDCPKFRGSVVDSVSTEDLEALCALTRSDVEDYLDFIVRASKNPKARRVKLADLRDNL